MYTEQNQARKSYTRLGKKELLNKKLLNKYVLETYFHFLFEYARYNYLFKNDNVG